MAVKNRMMVRTAVDRATMRLHSRDRLRVTSSILSVARRDEGGRSFDADSVEVTLRLVQPGARSQVQKNAKEPGHGCAGF